MMNIYDPIFTSAQVAAAAGMTHGNFRAYLARESTGWRPIGQMSALPADKLGAGHKFSIYDALGYALAAQLVALGVQPQEAFQRGMFDFAHSSGDQDREPGGVFDPATRGFTLYVYSPGATLGRCVATNDVRDPIELLFPPMYHRASSAVIVNLNDLRERVFRSLGFDARDYE